MGSVVFSFDFFFRLVFSFLAGAGSESEKGLISVISKISGIFITGGSVWVPSVTDFFLGGRVCVSVFLVLDNFLLLGWFMCLWSLV